MSGTNWYFVAYLVLTAMGLGRVVSNHGKPKTGTDNAWSTLVACFITCTLVFFVGRAGL